MYLRDLFFFFKESPVFSDKCVFIVRKLKNIENLKLIIDHLERNTVNLLKNFLWIFFLVMGLTWVYLSNVSYVWISELSPCPHL